VLNGDQLLSDMRAEVMIVDGDVFSSRMQLGALGQLNRTQVALKDFASNSGNLHRDGDSKGYELVQ
jgi:hypothetical protein